MGEENADNKNHPSVVALTKRTGKFKVTAEPAIFLLYLGVTIQV